MPIQFTHDADLLIVGAGTAGCVLARRLVEQTTARVVLIEAGPSYPGWALSAPLAGLRLRPRWSWGHTTLPQAELNHRTISIPMGRVVGGTSSVNAMVAAPGPPSDFDDWSRLDCPGWSAADIAACLKEASHTTPQTGPVATLPVSEPAFESPFSTAFLEACVQAGLQRQQPFTGSHAQTCGMFPLFQHGGRRCSTAERLVGLEHHPHFRLLTGHTVRRVLLDRHQAIGVELQTGSRVCTWRANAGVILAAGAIQTPTLLQRSGVGPALLLRAAGLDVHLDQPGVGEGLQDHIGVPLLFRSAVPSPGRPSRWLSAAIRWLLCRSGVMTSNCCEAGCFLGPGEGPPEGEIFTHFQTRRAPQAVELMCTLLHPASRGTVRIDPAQPDGPAFIDPRYLTDPADRDALKELVAQARHIAAQPALRKFGLQAELLPGNQPLDEFLRQYASTCHHPVGTCRMGTDPGAVVGPDLRVRGVSRLWIADNSIIPVIPRGHTASTALVIGLHGASIIARPSEGVAIGSPPQHRESAHCPAPPDASQPSDASASGRNG